MDATKKGPGRKPEITPDEQTLKTLFGLGKIQCTEGEIAAVLCVSRQTWLDARKRFPELAEVVERGRENGKQSLRRYQFQMAEKNPTMAIWLGKQWLGQRDNVDVNAHHKHNFDTSQLTDAQLDALESAIVGSAPVSGGNAGTHTRGKDPTAH